MTVNTKELKVILDGATVLAPASSQSSKRLLFTAKILSIICTHLNLNDPLDAAIFACITTTFYLIVRLGEFTVPAIRSFNPSKHITRENVSETVDCNEATFWAAQDGPSDPRAALENHIRVNPADSNAHLFAWKHPKGIRPLSKAELSKRLNAYSFT